jgi:hypothetical protein
LAATVLIVTPPWAEKQPSWNDVQLATITTPGKTLGAMLITIWSEGTSSWLGSVLMPKVAASRGPR